MKKYFAGVCFYFIFLSNIFAQINISSAEEAVAIGISNSEELQEMQKSSLLQMKSAKLSLIPFLPKIGINWNEYDKVVPQSADSRNKSIEFSLNQLLFDNGKTRLTYSINRYISYLEYLESKKILREKSIEIMETYYNLILQINLIDLKKEYLNTTEKELQIIEYKYNSGLAVKSDYLQYQISCHELSNDIIKLNQTKIILKRKLAALLGLPSETEINISNDISNINYSTKTLLPLIAEYEKQMLESDIDYCKSKADLDYQKKQYKITKCHYLPNISVEGGISFDGTKYPLTQPDYSIKLVFSFDNIPFIPSSFSNGYGFNKNQFTTLSNNFSTQISPDISYFTNQKITKSNLRQSEIKLQNKITELQNSTYQYLSENDNLIEYISLLKEANQLLKEKLKISEYEHNAGLLSTTDYLKELNSLEESDQKIIQSQIELIILQKKIEMLTKN